MQPSDYLVPKADFNTAGKTEYEIKKSRFIAVASRAENREQAMLSLDKLKKDYPDARHHCWAYVIGHPNSPQTVAMSDDGEPSGTAGKPILNVLQHKDIGDIMLVVVRYFGGIKLGAGGLVRAYSAATQLAISTLETSTKVFLSHYRVEGDFSMEQSLRHWLSSREGKVVEVEYAERVTLRVAIRESDEGALRNFIDAQGGVLATR